MNATAALPSWCHANIRTLQGKSLQPAFTSSPAGTELLRCVSHNIAAAGEIDAGLILLLKEEIGSLEGDVQTRDSCFFFFFFGFFLLLSITGVLQGWQPCLSRRMKYSNNSSEISKARLRASHLNCGKPSPGWAPASRLLTSEHLLLTIDEARSAGEQPDGAMGQLPSQR